MHPLDYGMPEYAAPETVKGEGASYPVDMWATGIITYILIGGTSPFRLVEILIAFKLLLVLQPYEISRIHSHNLEYNF